jgi:KUP system potassium uptake protein
MEEPPNPPPVDTPGTTKIFKPQEGKNERMLLLSLAALGVVYGDIGTSPLYALREAFNAEKHNIVASTGNILGVLSLIFWSLVIIISVKYLTFVLRADNKGEGGILALTSLVTPVGTVKGGRWGLLLLGVFGTALLFGEGVITPAISVLSAVEGLGEARPELAHWVIPITVVIIACLFLIQRGGTARIGGLFGPVTLLWFTTIAVLGAAQIIQTPAVLSAVSPHHGVVFLATHGMFGFLVLGSVFLVVTGGEALYADMGHFGRSPIMRAWFALVLPSLLLSYFGQGALLIRDASTDNPFYAMAPESLKLPLVVIATAATVIASQALISGAYSLSMQAVQLGFSPRLQIEHTSASHFGQIYVPFVNWALMLSCIGLVLGFRSSSNLAAAYGVAAATTMTITSVLLFVVARSRWKWPLGYAVGLVGALIVIDLAFWSANLFKVSEGGWFPIVAGLAVFTLLTTWKRGRQVLMRRMADRTLPRDLFIQGLDRNPPIRVKGTAVFMYRSPKATPPALLHNLKHNKVLHEQVIFLSVITEDVPHVPVESRSAVEALGHGVFQVILRYGFMEHVDVPAALEALSDHGMQLKPMDTTYFLGRETLIATKKPGMAVWRGKLFALMAKNERSATSFFKLPPNRVVELGAQIEL